MFSSTTMELSSSIPMPSASPPSVMMFSVNPPKYIRPNVAMMDTGIAMAMMVVLRKSRRKKSSTAIASSPPKRAALPTLEIERWM